MAKKEKEKMETGGKMHRLLVVVYDVVSVCGWMRGVITVY